MLSGLLSDYWGIATFGVLFVGGNVFMSKTKSWTKPRHHALVLVGSIPLFISMLTRSGFEKDAVFIAIVTWLAIVVPIIVVVQQMPMARVAEDRRLRWDLRKKRN